MIRVASSFIPMNEVLFTDVDNENKKKYLTQTRIDTHTHV